MSLEIGQKAPEFNLYNTEKNKIALSDYAGKNVVLLFFPLAFSGVCTNELCSIQENLSAYNDVDASVIGISIDSIFVLDKFKKELNLDFDLLSDFNKEAAKDYGCLFETFAFEMEGVSKRSVFVIDKEGVLKHIEILESAGDLPDFKAIQEILQTL